MTWKRSLRRLLSPRADGQLPRVAVVGVGQRLRGDDLSLIHILFLPDDWPDGVYPLRKEFQMEQLERESEPQ